MKRFRQVITEEQDKPFFRVSESAPKKSLLDTHIEMQAAAHDDGGRWHNPDTGNWERRTSNAQRHKMPDREMKHLTVETGNNRKVHGWGQVHASLDVHDDMSAQTRTAHKRAVEDFREYNGANWHPREVVQLYNPRRLYMHIQHTDGRSVVMNYNEGRSGRGGNRSLLYPWAFDYRSGYISGHASDTVRGKIYSRFIWDDKD